MSDKEPDIKEIELDPKIVKAVVDLIRQTLYENGIDEEVGYVAMVTLTKALEEVRGFRHVRKTNS